MMGKAATFMDVKRELKAHANPGKAKILAGFFKTGKGQYGEGDVFLGIMVPSQRAIAKKYGDLPARDITRLLESKIHEERLVALFILVLQYERADEKGRKRITDFYLRHTRYVNNWDLVDLSADKVLGKFLLDKPKGILYKLAKSKNVWERRIAVLATFRFIKHGRFEDALIIAEMLLGDKHDLIHKAVGWMLREVGNRSKAAETAFLKKHYRAMPRTMLRYSIEKFPEPERKRYLFGLA